MKRAILGGNVLTHDHPSDGANFGAWFYVEKATGIGGSPFAAFGDELNSPGRSLQRHPECEPAERESIPPECDALVSAGSSRFYSVRRFSPSGPAARRSIPAVSRSPLRVLSVKACKSAKKP